jgi:metal-responsive CopG/Arc/MetJ family transcriptional regulator
MAKTKVSVTVDAAVLAQVDQFSEGASRSEIVERALKRWLNDRRRRDLEDQIAAYYLSQRDDERREERDWARLSADQIRKTWG